MHFNSMCLSGHRKYSLGSSDPKICARGMEIMEKAIRLSEDLGIRIIQLAGYDVYSAVSYRNYEHLTVKYQKMIYAGNDAATIAQTFLAPGLNDHQTGLSFDLTTDANESINYGDFYQENIEETDAYKWMVEHCQDYGFILRYPEDKAEYYGTPCRNAHFRYVGEEAAKYIMENDLCLEEFIRLYDEKAVFVPAIDVEK